MAERRYKKELDVPSMSSVTPTARPGHTYVKPHKRRAAFEEPSQLFCHYPSY